MTGIHNDRDAYGADRETDSEATTMPATPERVTGDAPGAESVVWHKPVGRVTEEFQAIACSDTDGIVFPAPRQNVPLRLDKPGELWCPDCLALIRTDRATGK